MQKPLPRKRKPRVTVKFLNFIVTPFSIRLWEWTNLKISFLTENKGKEPTEPSLTEELTKCNKKEAPDLGYYRGKIRFFPNLRWSHLRLHVTSARTFPAKLPETTLKKENNNSTIFFVVDLPIPGTFWPVLFAYLGSLLSSTRSLCVQYSSCPGQWNHLERREGKAGEY